MKYIFSALTSFVPLFSVGAKGLADPLAFANAEGLAIADTEGASYDCHSNCGYAILAARKCSPDGESDSDYDTNCLCKNNTQFLSLAPKCLDCGWCLWSDYGTYLTSAFGECGFSTQPTGTTCLEDKTSYLEAYGTGSQTATSVNSEASSYASKYAGSTYYGQNRTETHNNSTHSSGGSTTSDTNESSTLNSVTISEGSSDSSSSTGSESSSTNANTSSSTGGGNFISLGLAPLLAFISIALL